MGINKNLVINYGKDCVDSKMAKEKQLKDKNNEDVTPTVDANSVVFVDVGGVTPKSI